MGAPADGAQAPGEPTEAATAEMPKLDGAPGGESPAAAHAAPEGPDAFAERPEVFVGAAFAGGLVLAQVLRRLRR
jgi:hypothetical protein